MARRSVTSFVSRDVGLPPSGAAIADSTARLNLRSLTLRRRIRPNFCRPDVAINAFQLTANPVRQS